MSSYQALDRAILAIVQEQQPIKLQRIVDEIERTGHRGGMKSTRQVTERIYALKREGSLVMLGERHTAQYTTPHYQPATKRTEAQRQAADARMRERIEQPAPAAPVVVEEEVDHDLPEGWRTLREQVDTVEAEQIVTTTTETIAPVMPPIAKRAPLSLSISALAADVAAQVAMTVERVVGQDVKRYEGVIGDLRRQLEQKDQEIDRLTQELKAAEQLGQEAEGKYNDLRAKLHAL